MLEDTVMILVVSCKSLVTFHYNFFSLYNHMKMVHVLLAHAPWSCVWEKQFLPFLVPHNQGSACLSLSLHRLQTRVTFLPQTLQRPCWQYDNSSPFFAFSFAWLE